MASMTTDAPASHAVFALFAVHIVLWHCTVGYTNQVVGLLRTLAMVRAVIEYIGEHRPEVSELVISPHSSVVAYNMPLKQSGDTGGELQGRQHGPRLRPLDPKDVLMRRQMRGDNKFIQADWVQGEELEFGGDPIELLQMAPLCSMFRVWDLAARIHAIGATAAPNLRVTTLAFHPPWLPEEPALRFVTPKKRTSIVNPDFYNKMVLRQPHLFAGLELVQGEAAWADCNELHQCSSDLQAHDDKTGEPPWPSVRDWARFMVDAMTTPGQPTVVGLPCMFWCLGGARGVYDIEDLLHYSGAARISGDLERVADELTARIAQAGLKAGENPRSLGDFVGLHLRREPDMCMSTDGKGLTNPASHWCLISMQEITDELLDTGTLGVLRCRSLAQALAQ